jgi:hypothetical protein
MGGQGQKPLFSRARAAATLCTCGAHDAPPCAAYMPRRRPRSGCPAVPLNRCAGASMGVLGDQGSTAGGGG